MHILQYPAAFRLWQSLPKEAKITFHTKNILNLPKAKNYNAKENIYTF